ncbi:MAG: TetR/AcrR family transcriptional regulator [Deltaproteobacteria bacterium]|nr:TetR/AcrR family transcriptional regulator [Deltaproteobacteria bacterium]
MPKAPRTAEEVDLVKQAILTKALQLIVDEGYNKLSMRKIASRLGITAANIYNYFASKEEINLWIRIKGFEIMDTMLSKSNDEKKSLVDNLRGLLRAYFEFGTAYSEYYDIIFNLRTPKVTDYIGTEFEEIAMTRLRVSGRRCLNHFLQIVEKVFLSKDKLPENFTLYKTTQLWSDMHGLVSLYNSNQIQQVVDNPKEFIDSRIEALIRELLGKKRLKLIL